MIVVHRKEKKKKKRCLVCWCTDIVDFEYKRGSDVSVTKLIFGHTIRSVVWLHEWLEDWWCCWKEKKCRTGEEFAMSSSFFFLFFLNSFFFFFCRNDDWREQNTGRFTNIVSGCGFLFFFPLTHRADFSQSCHCCSVSLHWITTSTVTTGEFRNLHLPSRFLKGGTLSQIWVLAALYHSIFIFLVPLFNRLCFFWLYDVLRLFAVCSTNSLSYCVFVTEGWSICVCGCVHCPFRLLLCFTHIHIQQYHTASFMYLCWYFVNNKRREKRFLYFVLFSWPLNPKLTLLLLHMWKDSIKRWCCSLNNRMPYNDVCAYMSNSWSPICIKDAHKIRDCPTD